MGSAKATARTSSYVPDLFREIARLAIEAPDGEHIPLIADLLDDALAHPDSHRIVLTDLAEFMSTCYCGSVPDPDSK